MTEPALEAEVPSPPKRRRGLAFALGCLGLVFVCCCTGFGLFVFGASRHAADIARFTPPPRTDPAAEPDPDWRTIAQARHDAPMLTCESLVATLRAELVPRTDAELVVFHEWLRARLAEANIQKTRDACEAAEHGGCTAPSFLAFRASLVLLGRASFERALREPDSLAHTLDPDPGCGALTWVVLDVLREHARVAASLPDASVAASFVIDGGVAVESDGGVVVERDGGAATEADAGPAPRVDAPDFTPAPSRDGRAPNEPPPFDDATTTRDRDRLDLPEIVPAICARYSCSPGDVFEDDFDFEFD